MKKIILLLCALVLIVRCTKQPYYEIPLNSDGTVYLTGVPVADSPGISTLDGGFTVTATFVTAKAGDAMKVELLQLQTVAGQANKQLLPMAGTQQTVTVGSDMKAAVTYARAVAMLASAGDYVTVVYNGETDYARLRIDMVPATTVSKPMVGTKTIDVARTSEVAYFNVIIAPKEAAYAGTLVVKMKNGINKPLVELTGSPFSSLTVPSLTAPFNALVPISGTDFDPLLDTAYYVFTATKGSYVDEITYKVIVRDPYFYLKRTSTLAIGGNDAMNLLVNGATTDAAVPGATSLVVSISNTLKLKGGAAWLAIANNSIAFVPITADMYALNNSTDAIAAFNAGTPVTVADPNAAYYVFKATNGTLPSQVYYGMINFTSAIPGSSVTFEYRIGNQYAHLLVIQ